jgi:hypothetical protein
MGTRQHICQVVSTKKSYLNTIKCATMLRLEKSNYKNEKKWSSISTLDIPFKMKMDSLQILSL